MYSLEQFRTREAEQARREEDATRRERFEAPSRIAALSPRLRDKARERFEIRWGDPVSHGNIVVVDRETLERAEFEYSVRGAEAATWWRAERMGVIT